MAPFRKKIYVNNYSFKRSHSSASQFIFPLYNNRNIFTLEGEFKLIIGQIKT